VSRSDWRTFTRSPAEDRERLRRLVAHYLRALELELESSPIRPALERRLERLRAALRASLEDRA